jgi:hypothetical protein
MRRPRFRFTVRGMMVAVAIAAVIMGAATLMVRRRGYLALAEKYTVEERLYVVSARGAERDRDKRGSEAVVRTWAQRAVRLAGEAREAARLRMKYERAARYPWLPVAPDPPEPK